MLQALCAVKVRARSSGRFRTVGRLTRRRVSQGNTVCKMGPLIAVITSWHSCHHWVHNRAQPAEVRRVFGSGRSEG